MVWKIVSGNSNFEHPPVPHHIETFHALVLKMQKKNDSRILGVKIKHDRMPPYTRVPSLKKVQKEGGVMSI